MKKIIYPLLLAIPFFSTPISYSQSTIFDWAAKLGGTNTDYGYSAAVDASGNVYTTGTFQGTADFDPGVGVDNLTSAGVNDIFISKLDMDGNSVWAKRIGGTGDDQGRSLTVDNAGNVYITGSFRGTVDFDPGAGTSNLTSAGSDDIFISKLDADGNFLWVKKMGGTNPDVGYSIAVDATGNIYTTGTFSGTADFDPGAGTYNLTANIFPNVFISKLDANGNFVLAKSIGSTDNDEGRTVKVDASENIYITGYFTGTVDFDPGTGTSNLTSVGAEDIFISKLDAAGNFLWAKNIGGIGFDVESDIVLDASGNVYVTGAFQGTADFDPGTGTYNQTSAGILDVFILKLDTNGNFMWAKTMGGTGTDSGLSISLDAAGNIYTTGTFTGTVDFNPGAGTYNRTSAGGNDIFMLKLNANGNFVWAKTMGAAGYDFGRSITLDTSGNIYTIGGFVETVDFDSETGISNLTSLGDPDIFILKLLPCQPVYGTDVISSCGSYTWIDGIEYSASTDTPTFTLTSASDCDSIVTLNLTMNQASTNTVTETACSSFTWTNGNGQTYNTSTTATHTIVGGAASGCDSIVTLNLTIGDAVAPVANAANLSNVTAQCSVTSLTAPTATDNCAGTITGTHSTTLPITAPGTTVITWTYADGNGNSSTQTQNVIITLPVATTTLSGLTISATTSGATYQWINCGNGNTPIAGATSQSFTATANGTYAVIVTQNGCSDTSACVAISTVGLDEFAQALFTVYPNPNDGTFVVTTEFQATITITNAAGQWISTHPLKSGENTIELSHVESGVYFISAMNSNGQVSVQRVSVF